MFAKFALLFLVAGAISLPHEAFGGPIIYTIAEAIRDLLDKVEATISVLRDLIKNLEDKIFKIISAVNLPETLAKIKNKIKDLLDKADLDLQQAKECLMTEHSAVSNLTKNVVKGVKDCMAYTEEERNKIREGVKKYIAQGNTLIQDMHIKIHKCVQDHIVRPEDFFECLENIKESSFKEMLEFVEITGNMVEELEKDVAGVAVDLAVCIQPVVEFIETEQNKIITDFETCINKIAHP